MCGGSGDAFLPDAAAVADVYVTSDLRHHRAQDHLVDGGCALIDVSHWASEWPWLPVAADALRADLAALGSTVEVHVSTIVHRSVDRPCREPSLNAEPATQLRLLEVQEKDTRLSQLAHRGRTLPDAALLAEIDTRLARLRDEVVAAETIASDLAVEQARADQDVAQVRERAKRDRELLDSGAIGDPKQLQSLQSELESLARRQSDLEDVELEIMERADGARAAVVQLTEQRDALALERDTLAAGVQRAAGRHRR